MQIVFYNDNGVLNVIRDAFNIRVKGDTIEYNDNNKLSGINCSYIILDDDIEVTEITPEILALDKSNQFKDIDPLEQRLHDIEAAIAFLFGGMSNQVAILQTQVEMLQKQLEQQKQNGKDEQAQ